MKVVHALALVAVSAAACGGSEEGDPLASSSVCSSAVIKGANESEGPLMMPGRACNVCHEQVSADTGEAPPIFRFAGTVFPTGHEPDDCVGAGSYGAQVWVTDASGFIFSAAVNQSGNFMLETKHTFEPPYFAEVHSQGRVRSMRVPQVNGDCNSCHTQQGLMAAPGRIVTP